MAGPIRIAILANGAQARKEFSSTGGSAQGMGSKVAAVGKKMAAGLAIGAVAAVAVGAKMIQAGERMGTSNARIEQVAKSMGLFGKETDAVAGRLVNLANKQARQTGIDQNSIKATQAKLLTFKELATSADKVGGNFDRATTAALDLASAGFGSAESNAAQLGKALNDPVKGLTALTRSGVTFTESEKKRISTLVESNKVGEAQNTILKAIEGQVGGTATATANGTDRIKVAFSQLVEQGGAKLTPFVDKFADLFINKIIPSIQTAIPVIVAFAQSLGDRLAPVVSTVSTFVTGTLVPALTRFGSYVIGTVVPAVLKLYGKVATNLQPALAAMVEVVQKAAVKFREWQPTIQKIIEVTAKIIGKVVEFASKILGTVLPTVIRFTASLNIGLIGAIITTITTIAKIIGKVIEFGGAVVDGARKVGEFASKIKTKVADVVGYFTSLPGKITGALSGAKTLLVETGKNIVQGLADGIDAVKDWVIAKIKALADLVPGWIRRRLGIASPSKVTKYLGKMAGQGLGEGIKSKTGFVAAAADKLGEKVAERIQKKIDDTKGLRDSITSLRDSLAATLTGDLFGGTGDEESTALDKFRAGLEAAKAKAIEVAKSVQTLLNQGVNKGFIENLVKSGNSELIVQLAGAPDVADLVSTYEAVIAQNEDTGRVVAETVIGTRLDTVNQQLADLARQLAITEQAYREERRQPMEIKLSGEKQDAISRGREYTVAISAYKRAGGRWEAA